MSDLSPEATVAAEAAASAVEELHERESVENHALDAHMAADDAVAISSEAAQEAAVASSTADIAAFRAEEAAEIAVVAGTSASEAQETASTAIDYAQQAFNEAAAARQENKEFREELLAILRPPVSEGTDNSVSEVPVSDSNANDANKDPEHESESEAGSVEDSGGERRHGRRVRRNRGR